MRAIAALNPQHKYYTVNYYEAIYIYFESKNDDQTPVSSLADS